MADADCPVCWGSDRLKAAKRLPNGGLNYAGPCPLCAARGELREERERVAAGLEATAARIEATITSEPGGITPEDSCAAAVGMALRAAAAGIRGIGDDGAATVRQGPPAGGEEVTR